MVPGFPDLGAAAECSSSAQASSHLPSLLSALRVAAEGTSVYCSRFDIVRAGSYRGAGADVAQGAPARLTLKHQRRYVAAG